MILVKITQNPTCYVLCRRTSKSSVIEIVASLIVEDLLHASEDARGVRGKERRGGITSMSETSEIKMHG